MFELPTLNSLDAIDRQQVHYATIQLNGPKFPIDTADYFNLVIENSYLRERCSQTREHPRFLFT